MARSNFRKDFDLGVRIIDLQRSQLLRGLSPERIASLAKHTRSLNLELEDSRKVVDNINSYCIFIASGIFDEVYVSSDITYKEFSNIISLRELSTGDFWGEYTLISNNTKGFEHTKLRLLSESGRLVYMPSVLMKQILNNYPSVHTALLSLVLNRSLENTLDLGEVKNELEDRNYILNRVDNVGKLLSGMLEKIHDPDSSGEIVQQIQNKYLLSKKPDLLNIHYEKTYLEQGYLVHKHEDRIRSTNNEKYTRTTKFGQGKTRTVQEYSISYREYKQLHSEIIKGSVFVKKYRYKVDLEDLNIMITIDDFLGDGNLKGLYLAEINYPDKENYEKNKDKIPKWLEDVDMQDVTNDNSYSNYSLALHGIPNDK